ncbi:MAG: type II toxin-antitoxin system HicA family toxin [Candidatus Gracilibacteria bacterium]|jgi:predicted RNA binding protein YcfA (HicA-like mRNA interferase family)
MLENKRLSKFLNSPTNTRLADIEYLLLANGFIKIYAKGSHVKFKHQNLKRDLIIPTHCNDCKPFYKKLATKILKELTRYKNG